MNRICPLCMSSHLDLGNQTLVVDAATPRVVTCLNCKWQGTEADLIGIPDGLLAKHANDGLSPDQSLAIIEQMAQKFLIKLASTTGQNIGLALVEAGFVGLHDYLRLGRLIRAACLGAVRGALAEAERLQIEVQNANQPS